MKQALTALLSGLLFGTGLVVAGMTKPSKVIAFLDVAGPWDASLAFVLGGGLLTHLLLYRFIARRRAPLFDGGFHIPTRTKVDGKLIVGAVVFGAGWGLGGFCPGPGIVGAVQSASALVFAGAMVVGMGLHAVVTRPPGNVDDA